MAWDGGAHGSPALLFLVVVAVWVTMAVVASAVRQPAMPPKLSEEEIRRQLRAARNKAAHAASQSARHHEVAQDPR